MNMNLIARLAREFWSRMAEPDSFPRDIESAVSLSIPMAIVKLPRLEVSAIAQWFDQRGIQRPFPPDGRPLAGCLIAFRGQAIAFLDGAEPADERRFNLAHEVAHFLLDYLEPRLRALDHFGPSILDVLDGLRRPSVTERVDALLSRVALGAHVHLMERGWRREVDPESVAVSEHWADVLALELLAPRKCVTSMIKRVESSLLESAPDADVEKTAWVLAKKFGLPAVEAGILAKLILKPGHKSRSLLHELGFSPVKKGVDG